MNIEQLRAKFGVKTNEGAVQTAEAKETKVELGAKVKEVASKTGDAVMNQLPVRRKTFKAYAQATNERLNNVDREAWKARMVAEIVADATGVNVPSEEELDAMYEEFMAAEEEAQQAAEKAAKEETEKEEAEKAAESLLTALFGKLTGAFDQSRVIEEVEMKEERKVELPKIEVEELSFEERRRLMAMLQEQLEKEEDKQQPEEPKEEAPQKEEQEEPQEQKKETRKRRKIKRGKSMIETDHE